MSTTAQHNWLTIAYLTCQLQATPSRIRAAAYAAGVRPTLVVNGSAEYFDEGDVERIRVALARHRAGGV